MTANKLFIALPLALALATGCTKVSPPSISGNAAASGPSDQQIAVDAQAKLLGDPAISNKQMNIMAKDGVVALSGEVPTDAERMEASSAVATVPGVKTVVNNLTVAPAVAAKPTPDETPKPAPAVTRRPAPRHRAPAPVLETAQNNAPPVKSYSDSSTPSTPPPAVVQNTAPQPPPPPAKVTVPAGTGLSVRLSQPLASDTNHEGDTFQGVLQSPIVVDDQVAIPQGANVEGRVVAAQQGGKFSGTPTLTLTLYSVNYNGHRYNIDTDQWSNSGHSRTKNSAEKIGGGAAVGAILGGIFGGGKGAAIGAASGGGLGAGAQGISKAPQVRLGSEATLSFKLQNPVTVSASPTNNTTRPRLEPPQE